MKQELINRYPGIRSFTAAERDLFFGRNEENTELYQLIKTTRLSVLFAKSGIGKSSILNAGVIPQLEADGRKVLGIRFQNTKVSPADMLLGVLKRYASEQGLVQIAQDRIKELESYTGQPAKLWEKVRAYSIETKDSSAPVLIFDQFEEFFLHSKEEQAVFGHFLADLAYHRLPLRLQTNLKTASSSVLLEEEDLFDAFFDEEEATVVSTTSVEPIEDKRLDIDAWWNKPLDYKVVMAIRSDKLSLLDGLTADIPAILDNRYQLKALNRAQATVAVLEPATLNQEKYGFRTAPFSYSTAALNSILDNLSSKEGVVESFQLQLVCGYLEEQVDTNGYTIVEEKNVGGQKGIERIINNYYESKIESIGTLEEQLSVRRLIEEGLVVEGVRVSLSERIVRSQFNIGESLLYRLEQTRIIKPEDTHLGKAYEISHDTLVAPILKSLKIRKERDAFIAAEKAQKRKEEEAKAEFKRLEAAAALERKKRKRATWLAIGAVVLSLVAIGATGIAFQAYRQAELSKHSALKSEELAHLAEEKAIESAIYAEKAKKRAEKERDKAKESEKEALLAQENAYRAQSAAQNAMRFAAKARRKEQLAIEARYKERLANSLEAYKGFLKDVDKELKQQQKEEKRDYSLAEKYLQLATNEAQNNDLDTTLLAVKRNNIREIKLMEGFLVKFWNASNKARAAYDWEGVENKVATYLKQADELGVAPNPAYKKILRDAKVYSALEDNMVAVDGGTFEMGCKEGRDDRKGECYEDEILHKVTLSDFKIGKFEITVALWEYVMGYNPAQRHTCLDCPVERVSWVDAQDFAAKLYKNTGKKYRLPTEAEWEYAARGGRLSKNYVYAGGNKMSKVGWFRDNSDMGTGRQSHPVGKLKPNELGLYDMSGNISEWCADSYLDKYDSAPVTNPLLVNEKDLLKVTRGSSFYFGTSGARPSARDFEVSSTKENLVGLRLAL